MKPTLYWNSIQYALAAVVNERGQAVLVVGRAFGERSDGQGFWSSVNLPWVYPLPDWNWTMRARTRLDSFLSPFCRCEAGEKEVKTCWIHEELQKRWRRYDDVVTAGSKEKLEKIPQPGGVVTGAAITLRLLHRDYPWVRLDERKKEFVCLLCNTRQSALDNQSWRNQFIQKHSHCGFQGEKDIPGTILSRAEIISLCQSIVEDRWKRLELTHDEAAAIAKMFPLPVVDNLQRALREDNLGPWQLEIQKLLTEGDKNG